MLGFRDGVVLTYRRNGESWLIEFFDAVTPTKNAPTHWMPLKLPNALAQAEAQHDQRQNA